MQGRRGGCVAYVLWGAKGHATVELTTQLGDLQWPEWQAEDACHNYTDDTRGCVGIKNVLNHEFN